MKFTKFNIKNFKGIEDVTVDLDKSPDANIYTLIGLNESGKTTILEAINFFNPSDEGASALELPGAIIKDYNLLIPIAKRDNFNGIISLQVTLKLDEADLEQINIFTNSNTLFRKVETVDKIIYTRKYNFKNSKFQKVESYWTGFNGWLKTSRIEKYISITGENGAKYTEDNSKLYFYCRELIPNILYFPTFLFDFPSKIYLETEEEATAKEKFYIPLRMILTSRLILLTE
jgi:AAA15 family ATPase/GTPase